MDVFKKLIIVFSFAFVAGCYVPGTYFSNEDISSGYYYQGKKVDIEVTQITLDWVSKYGTVPYEYRVGPYDVLNIVVWDHPELTTVTSQQAGPGETGILVNQDGVIFFPFAGEVKVAGLTLAQARKLLESKLSKYIQVPQVSVRVAGFRSQTTQILADGVARSVSITDKPLSIMSAINESGAVNGAAKTVQIYILREESPGKLHLFWFNAQKPAQLIAAEHFYLQNNDVVYVSPAGISSWNKVIGLLLPTVGAKDTVVSELDG